MIKYYLVVNFIDGCPIFYCCINTEDGFKEILNLEEYLNGSKALLKDTIVDGKWYAIKDKDSLLQIGRVR